MGYECVDIIRERRHEREVLMTAKRLSLRMMEIIMDIERKINTDDASEEDKSFLVKTINNRAKLNTAIENAEVFKAYKALEEVVNSI